MAKRRRHYLPLKTGFIKKKEIHTKKKNRIKSDQIRSCILNNHFSFFISFFKFMMHDCTIYSTSSNDVYLRFSFSNPMTRVYNTILFYVVILLSLFLFFFFSIHVKLCFFFSSFFFVSFRFVSFSYLEKHGMYILLIFFLLLPYGFVFFFRFRFLSF